MKLVTRCSRSGWRRPLRPPQCAPAQLGEGPRGAVPIPGRGYIARERAPAVGSLSPPTTMYERLERAVCRAFRSTCSPLAPAAPTFPSTSPPLPWPRTNGLKDACNAISTSRSTAPLAELFSILIPSIYVLRAPLRGCRALSIERRRDSKRPFLRSPFCRGLGGRGRRAPQHSRCHARAVRARRACAPARVRAKVASKWPNNCERGSKRPNIPGGSKRPNVAT